jgi:hypothetical protein
LRSAYLDDPVGVRPWVDRPVVVDEELSRRFGVEVDEAGGVGRATRVLEHRQVQRTGQLVHGEEVVAAVADPGRSVRDGVEDLLYRGAHGR